MAKYEVVRSLSSILSAMFLLPGCSAFSRTKIDLSRLYRRTDPLVVRRLVTLKDGNFLETTDGTILFFNPGTREKLRSILSKLTPAEVEIFQIYSPKKNQSEIRELKVEECKGELKLGSWIAKKSELDRLLLPPDWAKVYQHIASLYPSETKSVGIWGSSIVRLSGSRFLITGGSSCSNASALKQVKRTATIFDSSDGKVIKQFLLHNDYNLHLSARLADGKVLLIGSYFDSKPTHFEVVDPDAGSSRVLNTNNFVVSRSTYCVDCNGNCLVLGGLDKDLKTDPSVYRVDVATGAISRLPNLKEPRCYINNDPIYHVSENAIFLTDNLVLISAGSIKGRFGDGPILNAEIYNLAENR